jgi:hypothetical protein
MRPGEELFRLSVQLEQSKDRNSLLVLLAASQSSKQPTIVQGPAIELLIGTSVLCQPAAIARWVYLV